MTWLVVGQDRLYHRESVTGADGAPLNDTDGAGVAGTFGSMIHFEWHTNATQEMIHYDAPPWIIDLAHLLRQGPMNPGPWRVLIIHGTCGYGSQGGGGFSTKGNE